METDGDTAANLELIRHDLADVFARCAEVLHRPNITIEDLEDLDLAMPKAAGALSKLTQFKKDGYW